MTVKVIEFNRDDKRILVSHLRYLEDIKKEAVDTVKEEKAQQRKKTRSAVKKQQSKVEKTTLGELDVFTQLKEQFAETDQPAKAAAKPKAEEKKKEEKKAPAKKASSKTGSDDLKKIEGIGPKISEIMASAGYDSFEALSKADAETLKNVLAEAGSRYKMFDPTTWPEQAKLAAAGEWDKLAEWQGELKGGK